jgi:hypothetical protein
LLTQRVALKKMDKLKKDAALVAAWSVCDAETVHRLLRGKRVLDHMYLLEMSGMFDWWGPSRMQKHPGCLRVFIRVADEQNVNLLELQRICEICERTAEFCHSFVGEPVMQEARALAHRAREEYPRYQRNCRATLTALLGCVGKPKRAYGGALRDVMRAVGQTIWRTQRRNEKWGNMREQPRKKTA